MANKIFNQVCFNELTLEPSCKDEKEVYQRVNQYAQTLKSAYETLGTKVVRYEEDLAAIKLSEGINLREFCNKYRREAGIIAILSSATMPQVDPDDEIGAKAYKDTLVMLQNEEKCSDGLAAAYVNDVPSIGFASCNYWNDLMHDFRIFIGKENIIVENYVIWPCLTAPEHLQQEEFKHWIQEHSSIEPQVSSLSYEEKIADIDENLRDDHGKDVLKEHAKRLCHSEYVDGILCSRPFASQHRDYIKHIFNDGLIDIVLFWDDRGLSMRVKTTGRTIQETTFIANLLRAKYSK